MRLEPVAVAAAVRAVLLAVAAFGLDLSGEQIAAAAVAVEAVLALVVRSQVTPEAKIQYVNSPEEAFDLLTGEMEGEV